MRARKELDAGSIPADLPGALTAGARAADEAWAAGEKVDAALRLAQTLDLAGHRALHFDGLTSPLTSDPEGFLAPLRSSAVFQRAQTDRGRAKPAVAKPTRRLLVVSFKNWKFLGRVLERYEASSAVEVRRLDLGDLRDLPLSVTQQTRERMLGPADARARPWATQIVAQLDWCDTVWVEWGQRAAVLMSLFDPGDARVVVRLHSYEAFLAYPHLVDWSRVDDLVFVGDHVRAFVERVAPAVSSGPRRHVVPNAMDLVRLRVDRDATARFTVGLIGWSAVAKDPLWALDVLAGLRRLDERYRLLLVGNPLDASLSATAAAYREEFDARIRQPDVAGAVDEVGHVDDIKDVLPRIGVILSSSVRESFHQGLAEGAASGALPVVRNWPMFAAYGGARSVFPDTWVVDDVDAAIGRIRSTSDEDTWMQTAKDAATTALQRFDWTSVAPDYDALLRVEAA